MRWAWVSETWWVGQTSGHLQAERVPNAGQAGWQQGEPGWERKLQPLVHRAARKQHPMFHIVPCLRQGGKFLKGPQVIVLRPAVCARPTREYLRSQQEAGVGKARQQDAKLPELKTDSTEKMQINAST